MSELDVDRLAEALHDAMCDDDTKRYTYVGVADLRDLGGE